jgi:hypothetical protein
MGTIKTRYKERPKARENFERTMTALFQAQKPKASDKPKRKKKGKD